MDIPRVWYIIDVLTYNLKSWLLLFERLCAKKRWSPIGIPSIAIIEKIPESEITIEDKPIISGRASFEDTSQNTNPNANVTKVSIYTYSALLATTRLLISFDSLD